MTKSSFPPAGPGSIRPMPLPVTQEEIKALQNIRPGTTVALLEIALAKKVCRDLQEARALLSQAAKHSQNAEVFRQKALELAAKWGLAVI